jgi:ribose-phosphate pyrophosphokinase
MEKLRPIILIWTSDREALITDIKSKLQILLGEQRIEAEIVTYDYFTDDSPNKSIEPSVRGKHVYILSDVYSDDVNKKWFKSSINDRYIFSKNLQRAAHSFGAKTTNVIYPTFPYGRDDKFDNMGTKEHMKRKWNLANMVIQDAITQNLAYVITHDIHNLATVNVPQIPWVNTKFVSLAYGWTIEEVMKRAGLYNKGTVLSGTDEWAARKIVAVCKDLKLGNLIAVKVKDYSQSQSIDSIQVYGNARDKDVILYDDILDTGGTMIKCLKKIHRKGPKSVNLLISHALFNGNSLKDLLTAHKKGMFTKLYITNAVMRTHLDEFFAKHTYPSFIESDRSQYHPCSYGQLDCSRERHQLQQQ